MQAEVTILERFTRAYVAYHRLRLICVLAVLSAGLLLFLLAGGFPPWPWRLLLQALPQLSTTLALHGSATVLALSGLLLTSFSLVLAWCVLLWLAWRMLAHWLQERQELQSFAEDAREAHVRSAIEVASPPSSRQFRSIGALVDTAFARPLPTGQSTFPQRQSYALAPVQMSEEWDDELDEQEEEGEMWLGYQEDDDERAENYQEGLEEEEEPGMYQDGLEEEQSYEERGYYEEESEEVWEDERHDPDFLPAPAQPQRIEHLVGASAQQANLATSGSSSLRYSSYGRFVPAPAASSVGTLPTSRVPRLSTILYDRGSAPTEPLAVFSPAEVRPSAVQLIISTGLDVGFKRKGKPNEDSLLSLQNTRVLQGTSCPVGLFAIADGMGGHQNGQEASRMVIQSLSQTVVPAIIHGPADDNYAELLSEGVHHANLAIYQRNRQEIADMGTTVAAALVINTTAYIANVGDSRAYLYRPGCGLSQITRDHSIVARLVENGLIKPGDIYTHPRRNEIYRSLGRHPSEEIDSFTVALQTEDLLLLCSDGLWEMVRDDQLQQVIEATLDQPSQLGTALVQAALNGGGQDNISLIGIRIKPFSGVGESA